MPKVATPKQTGHGGPDFEAKTSAYFLSCMLTKTLPFSGIPAVITRIDFQTRADGWLLDDALLTIDDNNAIRRIAVSTKSNQQFNTRGCPKDLNRILWEQYLGHNTTIFKPASDFLCLAESVISSRISAGLNTLLSQAKAQDAQDLSKRLYTEKYSSKLIREIYESMECPADLKELYSVDAAETVNLLKRFLHVEMDFEKDSSVYKSMGIELCRSLLVDKDIKEAQKLFGKLIELGRELIKSGGYLDVPTLLHYIKQEFVVEGIPDYKTDWKKLSDYSLQRLSLVQNKLGKKISIDRNACIAEIEERLKVKPICLISGISGAGKTALAKEFAESKYPGASIIWMDAGDLDSSMEFDLQLQHLLIETIRFVPSKEAYFFIDGAEKLYKEKQQKKLALLFNTMLSINNTWKIIITCPAENVDALLQHLYQQNVNMELADTFDMPFVTEGDILNIAVSYPQLTPFLIQQPVQNILNNLKLFDKVLFNIDKIASLSQVEDIGETHIIDFVWDAEIENTEKGIQKSSFLKSVSEKQADNLSTGVSTADFDPANISVADDLKATGLIRIQHQKIFFTHDLYADWGRYKLLQSHCESITSFLNGKHLSSPLWTKAIRLYGIALLEKDSSGKSWRKNFELFKGTESPQLIIQNLLLEGFIFSHNSYFILNHQKELLFEKEGKILKKLLSLFQNSATIANPSVLKMARTMGGFTETEASAYDRMPIIWYWPDVLNFINENLEEALKIDLVSVVNIATIWLNKTRADFICRKEAGNITLTAARFIFEEKLKGRYVDPKITEPVYNGLLSGYAEHQETVADLCLNICKRKKSERREEKKTPATGTLDVPKAPNIMDRMPYPRPQRQPWEDGPFERVDSTFQKLCLETGALMPLVFLNPGLGKEILLAVLIDEPDDRYLGMNPYEDNYSIYNPSGWYPPFFLRGPFFNFLKWHPEHGIDFIIRITNFAIDRWLENNRELNKTGQSISLIFDGETKTYHGDCTVFGWAKSPIGIPHLLASVLMAFEEFLCQEIEKNNPVEKYVEYTIGHTHSLAIVAILITVGKFKPELFVKELKSLLPVHLLYRWDYQAGYHDPLQISELPVFWHEWAEKWKQRRTRLLTLKDTLINFFLVNKELQKVYKEITPQWKLQLEQNKVGGNFDMYLFQMIPQFDKDNYTERQQDGNFFFEFTEPKEVCDTLKEGRQISLADMEETQVSFKMEMMLEQELPFDLASAEYLMGKIQRWGAVINDENIGNNYPAGSPLTNAIASISVLLHHENKWIKERPEYSGLIISFLNRVIEMHLQNNVMVDRHGSPFDWNVKFASIIPALWRKDITDKILRKMVAVALIFFNETTSNAFFQSAATIFKWNELPFIQVQNLSLQYNNERKITFANIYAKPEQLRPLREKYMHQYTEGNIPSTPMEWPIDSHLRTAKIILHFLPSFQSINEKEERAYILFLIRQGVMQLDAKLMEIKGDEHPDDFDRTILARVADCLPYLSQEEKPEFLWGDILKFGYLAHKWVTRFCESYFRIHLHERNNYPAVIALLEKMVIFADKFTTWETKKSVNYHEDFRNCLVGLSPGIRDLWKVDYSSFIKQAINIYSFWFAKNKYNKHTIKGMLDMVITKSGEPIIKDAFQHIKTFFSMVLQKRTEKPAAGYHYEGNKDLDNKLASSLSLLWENKKDLVTNDAEIFSDYRELLQYLVAIENLVGVELQQRLLLS